MPEFKWNIKEDGIDEVFDERGNSLLKLSETIWNDRPAKLELRKWVMGTDGSLTPNKGFSFLTEQGPHDLTHVLLEKGYGDNNTIKEIMEKRGVNLDIETEEKESKDESGEFFNPSELLGD